MTVYLKELSFLLFTYFCRGYKEMVDMGLLDITFDVRAECNSGERIPREQLEKSNFLNYTFEHFFCLPVNKKLMFE